MTKRSVAVLAAFALIVVAVPSTSAQGENGYKLVPNWPKLPAGMYFGLKDAPPPPAEREAQAAARRASARGSTGSPQVAAGGGGQNANGAGPTNQPGISGLAIDQHDHI